MTAFNNKQIIVSCDTTVGNIDIIVEKEWSPNGANRFIELVEDKFFDNSSMFRSIRNWLSQFGIANTIDKNTKWETPIHDDNRAPARFKKGFVSFAGSGINSRTTQLFFTFNDNNNLGNSPWETPIGYVTPETLYVLDKINCEYGDIHPWNNNGPDPRIIKVSGNDYLKEKFPNLTYFNKCTVKYLDIV